MADCARGSAGNLAVLARRKRVHVELRLPEGLPLVRADKSQLRQVFTNLLDNALKFNAEGGKVLLTASADRHAVFVSIKTRVAASEDLPRIFERFYRVDKACSRNSGTGLGLAIVKHIVEAHGAWSRSKAGPAKAPLSASSSPKPSSDRHLGFIRLYGEEAASRYHLSHDRERR